MNVLISGSSGFIGQNLSSYLFTDGYSISSLDIVYQNSNILTSYISWDKIDITDINTYYSIIHLAGKAHDTNNEFDKDSYFKINFGLTKKLFDKFLDSKAVVFIFFSSVKAVADIVNEEILVEEVIPNPQGPYGESKLMAENYILNFFKTNDKRLFGKRVYILRPCMIHGPGNKGNLNLLYNFVKKSIPWPLGKFNNRRSFTSIENICYITNKLIKSEVPSGVYNIADDDPLSTNKIIELISNINQKKITILHFNKELIKKCALIGDILHLPLNSLRLKKLTENYVVSNKKIKEALGIKELPITAEEGLRKTLKSFNKL